jgi:phosphoadenosine phosphosulfate reductase
MRPSGHLEAFGTGELNDLNRRFETEPASAIVRWSVGSFGVERLCLTFSGQDTVLVDVAVRVNPDIEVVFIDTGYHFAETIETVERARARYDLNLRVMRVPATQPPLWQADPANCCSAAKVTQLDAALEGKLAWISGVRRAEAPTREATPIVGLDHRGLVKVNPLAMWSDLDVAGYVKDHDLVTNPLLDQGYLSIGCAPCTRPVGAGEHTRAGRWAESDKTECGLHTGPLDNDLPT